MSSPSATNGTPDALSVYVEELRRFSETYRISTGNPEDLQTLCNRLADDQDFLAGFQSMVRSILYREKFSTTPSRLLDLVGLAWGGTHLHDLSAAVHPPVCDLASFLREAMRFPQLEKAASAGAHGDLEETTPASTNTDDSQSFPSATWVAETASKTPRASEPEVVSDSPATRSVPWWSESATDTAFVEPLPTPAFLSQTELGTAKTTAPLTDDPWETNSAFHRELVRIVEQKRKLNSAPIP